MEPRDPPPRRLKLVPPPADSPPDDFVRPADRTRTKPDPREEKAWRRAVDNAWASRAEATKSADATQRALLKAMRWNRAHVELDGAAVTRLLRLVVLHRDDLGERRRRAEIRTGDPHGLVWDMDSLGGVEPGLGDDFAGLVREIVGAGDESLSTAILTLFETAEFFGADASEGRAHVAVWRELAERLPALSEGRRTCTIEWLAWSAWPGAAAPLRWALRRARLPDRTFALSGLCAIPGALRASDVDFVLADSLRRRVDYRSGGNLIRVEMLGDALARALRLVRPAEAVTRLLRHAREAELPEDDIDALGRGWALRIATSLDPAQALPELDRALRSSLPSQRRAALDALDHLPLHLALPRLRILADDPAPELSRDAREALAEHAADTAVPRTLGPLAALAEGPAKDFGLQLAAAAGTDDHREKLRRRLLRGPRSPSALALLLHLFAGGPERDWSPLDWDGTGERLDEIAAAFGDRLVDGVMLLLERHPEDAWIRAIALAQVHAERPFGAAAVERLRTWAEAGLAAASNDPFELRAWREAVRAFGGRPKRRSSRRRGPPWEFAPRHW